MNDSIFSKIFDIISLKRYRQAEGRIFKTDFKHITFTYDDLIKQFCFLDIGRSSSRLLGFSQISQSISEGLEKIPLDVMPTGLITLKETHRAFYLEYEPGLQGGHIGWNNAVLWFENNKMGIDKGDDSFEIFLKYSKYFGNSCKDLIEIRRATIEALRYLKDHDDILEASVFKSERDLKSGIWVLKKYALVFETVSSIVQSVLSEFVSFKTRKSALLDKSVNELGDVSSLLYAISNVKQ